MIDTLRIFLSLRPNAKFAGSTVNSYSLETIKKTFIGIAPTQSEMDSEWENLQIKDIGDIRILSIKKESDSRILNLDSKWTEGNHAEKQRNDLMAGAFLIISAIEALNSGVQADIDSTIKSCKHALIKAQDISIIRKMSNDAEINGDLLEKFISDLDAAGL